MLRQDTRITSLMFFGEYRYKLDDKGRVAMPVKFRKSLEHGAVVTRGLDTSLFLFPKEEWDKLAKKLAGLPLGRATSRALARLMLAGAMEVEVDQQGRFLVPEYLRKYAKIGKEAVIAGVYDRLEIWDLRLWEAYKRTTEHEAGDIAEQLGQIGL